MKKHFFNFFFILMQIFISVSTFAETPQSDCYLDICKGDQVYANYNYSIERRYTSELTTVVGFNGEAYVLRFETGEFKGKYGSNWTRDRLAITTSCTSTSFQLCVGEKVLFSNAGQVIFDAVVVGIQDSKKDKVVLKFSDKEIFGNYTLSESIYKTTGRFGSYSVGDLAINKTRNSTQVRVIGYNAEQSYMLEFLDGDSQNKRGSRWKESDLILLTPIKNSTKEVTVEDINSKMALQEGAQIIIKDKLYIPGKRGCGAPVESTQKTQCFVCQTNQILNGTLYEAEGILGVTQPILNSDRTEVSVQIVDSDDLNRIVCRSKTGQAVAIDSFETLQKALNDSGIYFKDPAPVLKTFGKVKSE